MKQRTMDYIETILTEFDKWFTDDPQEELSMFSAKKKLEFNNKDIRTLYLATHNGYTSKVNFVHRLCESCGIPESDILWYDGQQEVLW